MNNMFTYNQEEATQIGAGGQYVTQSGGYDLKVVRAQFKDGKSLEFDFETRDGQKLNYVSINFKKNNGDKNEFGSKMINAIMGCVGVQNLSADAAGNCPELFGKMFKGIVQRVDYTKQSGANAGQDGFKFDFKMPARIDNSKTVVEQLGNKPAEAFAKYAESVQDKDERQKQMPTMHQQQQQGMPNYETPPPASYDEMPDW